VHVARSALRDGHAAWQLRALELHALSHAAGSDFGATSGFVTTTSFARGHSARQRVRAPIDRCVEHPTQHHACSRFVVDNGTAPSTRSIVVRPSPSVFVIVVVVPCGPFSTVVVVDPRSTFGSGDPPLSSVRFHVFIVDSERCLHCNLHVSSSVPDDVSPHSRRQAASAVSSFGASKPTSTPPTSAKTSANACIRPSLPRPAARPC
jgi:hypothetical protein